MKITEITAKIVLILKGAESILKSKEIKVEEKNGIGNIVTSIDKKMEEYLLNKLSKAFPEAVIISEESADDMNINNITTSDSVLKFVVDPLDGTTNYTNGWPHTVSIGVILDNELVAGVIYDVLINKVYVGIKGITVMVNNLENVLEEVSCYDPIIKPEYSHNVIKKSVISYDTPYGVDAFKFTTDAVTKLYHAGASLKTVGPISLDVLKTALGKENRPHDYNCAVFHAEVRAWDLCAATCILRELGGEIIGMDGNPLSLETLSDPNARIAFIASGNKSLLNEMYELLKIK